MTKGRWITLLAALVFAAIVFLLWMLSGPAEPSHNGRKLSQWVEEISPSGFVRGPGSPLLPPRGQSPRAILNSRGQVVVAGAVLTNATMMVWRTAPLITALPAKHHTAATAIRDIGTNAIQHLLRTIYSHDGKLGKTCIRWWRKQNVVKLPFQTAEERQQHALPALAELGGKAVWAWVEIVTNELASPAAQVYAAGQLAQLGTASTPALGAMIWMQDHPHPSVQVSIRHAIQYCDKDGVVSALHNIRYSQVQSMRASAAWSLGFQGLHPDMSVPALATALNDRDALVRENAVEALGKFGTNSLCVTSAMRALLGDPARGVRRAATNALRQVIGIEVTD